MKKKTRGQIERKQIANLRKIEKLKAENKELVKEAVLLSDRKQQFSESIETIKERKNGKLVSREALVGRIHWKETFKDEDTGHKIKIDRTEVVRIDGNWNW